MNIKKIESILKLMLRKEGIYYSPPIGRKPGEYTFITGCGSDFINMNPDECAICEDYRQCKYLNNLCNILNSPEYEDPNEYFSTFELTCSWKGCKNKANFTVGSFRLCKKHAMELEGSLKKYVKEVEDV